MAHQCHLDLPQKGFPLVSSGRNIVDVEMASTPLPAKYFYRHRAIQRLATPVKARGTAAEAKCLDHSNIHFNRWITAVSKI